MGKRLRKLTASQRRGRYARRKLLGWLLAAAVVGVLVAADSLGVFGRAPTPDLDRYDGKTFRVVKVVDGDTLDVDVPDARGGHAATRIRLWGVDTPETVRPNTPVQHFGPEASAFTKAAATGKRVRLELDYRRQRGAYGRLLAYVHLPDGRMLNRVLIEEGYGYADPRFPHRLRGEFLRAQRAAMKAGRGLWKNVRPADLPAYHRNLKLPRRPAATTRP